MTTRTHHPGDTDRGVAFPNVHEEGGAVLRWLDSQLRNWMGVENLSCAIFEQPDMVRDMTEHWGGNVPHLDHLVPPGIPYRNFCEYLEQKRKLIGKL